MFQSVAGSVKFPELEANIGRLWRERRIYELSLAQRKGHPRFVFYEGPPTANGLPHPGHCLTRAIKDLFPRYRTMRGYLCERKAGWDTHGLPVEVEVCKELGIHTKEEIERYGVERFIHRCQESVWRYMKQWERLTERIGFWIRLDEAYVTYHQNYVESVWWSLKELFNRGLLYQGHKIVWWWAQGGTALSSGEVGQGYREVADPSVYVRFPLLDDAGKPTATSLLVWTSTPWTLPSNQFAAVHPELEYAIVQDPELDGQRLVIASALVETIAAKVKRPLSVEATLRGSELVGKRYVPPFDYYYKSLGQQTGELKSGGGQHSAWRVVAADFVTIDSGTGVVHQAPAFGEVDYEVLIAEQNRFDTHGPQLINAVAPDGTFTAEAPDYAGRWVKDCDKYIARELRRRGLLYHQEQYLHEYPFCWRAEEDPLIQYPRKSWFIRTSQFKDEMLANNERIDWLPEHIKHGRFGNFLESNVDWALSRERYWGTPLPIWVCERTGKMEAIGSYEELLAKPGLRGVDVWQAAKKANPELVDDLKVHKPYIDAVTYDSPFVDDNPDAPGPKPRMRRVGDVIDCWYDSGAMPFAQWGYPHRNRERFAEQFPADFISEAIDQTRGWFYSQLAISTLLFGGGGSRIEDRGPDSGPASAQMQPQLATDPLRDVPSHPGLPAAMSRAADVESRMASGDERSLRRSAGAPHEYPHPFRNCIVLGLMLGEDGQKMSKSKRNYREPDEIFDRYGADALRWYFFATQPPWTTIRYSEQAIKDSIPEFLLRLWNVYSFFTIYSNIDQFDPAAALTGDVGQLESEVLRSAKTYRPLAQRSELDRWIASELYRTAAFVTSRMDAYDNYAACTRLSEFVDAVSNWYVRRSRERFWSEDKHDRDKLDAYWTLYECLLTTCKLVAPFVPFIAEAMWQNLAVGPFGARTLESVHLCDYPTGELARGAIDEQLSQRMEVVREISSLGRSARTAAKLKVRQPLAKVEVILADAAQQPWLEDHAALIREELNVKQVEFAAKADQYINYTVLPDLKRLGPRLGKRLPAVKAALAKADAAALLNELESTGSATLAIEGEPVILDRDDLQVRLQAKPGWAAAQGKSAVVVLATDLSDALVSEGIARELVHVIQTQRKEMALDYTARIRVGVVTDATEIISAVSNFADYIQGETLASQLELEPLAGVTPQETKVGDSTCQLFIQPIV
jgi:isoleucyl-tRNA synthetase